MTKHLLDVGNCTPDHSSITDLVQTHFGAHITQTHGMDDTLQALSDGAFDLVTVNRLMDRDGASGLEIIKAIKNREDFGKIPVMLISNYENYQEEATTFGAESGFGKANLSTAETIELLAKFLS